MHHFSMLANASVIGIREKKLDRSVFSNEAVIEGYDLIRIDRSRKWGGVACFIKHSIAYSHKTNILIYTGNIFTEIYLPKLKPIIVGILYRPSGKLDLFSCINQIFS